MPARLVKKALKKQRQGRPLSGRRERRIVADFEREAVEQWEHNTRAKAR
jgi:hypothetical protein